MPQGQSTRVSHCEAVVSHGALASAPTPPEGWAALAARSRATKTKGKTPSAI